MSRIVGERCGLWLGAGVLPVVFWSCVRGALKLCWRQRLVVLFGRLCCCWARFWARFCVSLWRLRLVCLRRFYLLACVFAVAITDLVYVLGIPSSSADVQWLAAPRLASGGFSEDCAPFFYKFSLRRGARGRLPGRSVLSE